MTCCLGRKHKNLVLFWKISIFWWIITQSTILEDILRRGVCNLENIVTKQYKATLGNEILVISLYFLKYGNLHTKFSSECSLYHYAPKHWHRNSVLSWSSTEFPRQGVSRQPLGGAVWTYYPCWPMLLFSMKYIACAHEEQFLFSSIKITWGRIRPFSK